MILELGISGLTSAMTRLAWTTEFASAHNSLPRLNKFGDDRLILGGGGGYDKRR